MASAPLPDLRPVTGVSDLVTWLRAQLDDDERKVAAMEREQRRVQTAPIFQGYPLGWLAGVDIFVSPKRWQAEVDAKRQLLDWAIVWLDRDCAPWNETAIKMLALPYADRPGYLEEWRP